MTAVERELPWVTDLPEHDRRLFADEMAQLMAEAAQTDDFAEVDQVAAGMAGHVVDLL